MRTDIYHFYIDSIPQELLEELCINTEDDKLATVKQMQKQIGNFIKKARKIKPSYFITKKHLKLGDDISKVFSEYGEPDSVTTYKDIIKYRWDFNGDNPEISDIDNKNKKFAKNSIGHHIKMFVRNEKIIGIIFNNDIP